MLLPIIFYGYRAQEAVEEARKNVASLIHAQPEEIIFTSGATESNHFAIRGAAEAYQFQGQHLVTSTIEHSSVLAAYDQLRKEGYSLSYVDVKPDGEVDIKKISEKVKDQTTLMSLMLVNNETGVIQPVASLKKHLPPSVKIHCDAVAAVGKIKVNVNKLHVDYLSLSSHKLYGPKGVGALYVRKQPQARLQALFPPGEYGLGLRAGTLAVPQIVGFGEACRLAQESLEGESKRLMFLREQLWKGVQDLQPIELNGLEKARSPHILNLCIGQVDGEALRQALPEIAISSGSACDSKSRLPSHVLMAMGLPAYRAHQSLRLSLGRMTTPKEIERVILRLREEIKRLRKISFGTYPYDD